MNNRFSVMKRLAIFCISFFISCCVNTLGLSEEMYAENNDYEYLTVPCGNDAPALRSRREKALASCRFSDTI